MENGGEQDPGGRDKDHARKERVSRGEQLGCIRVQLKTDLRNERSQKAIERIGAVKEGVLRNHMILPDGRIRHSVFYSILDTEWPAVKKGLEELINRS